MACINMRVVIYTAWLVSWCEQFRYLQLPLNNIFCQID